MSHRSSRRSGKSLIEMIFVIAGMSVVLTTAGQLLHRVSRAERGLRNSAAVARAELRLTRDFRKDVRAATSVETLTAQEGDGLRLVSPETTVTYAARNGTVIRTTAAESDRKEGYRLGSVAVRFSLEDDRFAGLNVEPQRAAGRPEASSGRIEIVAAIGADRAAGRRHAAESRRQPVEAPRPESEVRS